MIGSVTRTVWIKAVGTLAFACSLTICSSFIFGQTAGSGAISGTTTDPSGAVVPQVTVTATRSDTGATRTTTTDTSGAYRFPLLLPGTYRLRFSAAGFKIAEVSSASVNVTETTIVDERLELGAKTEKVTVGAATTTSQSEGSTVGEVASEKDVSTLPLTNRNYTQILALAAGVQGSVTNAAVLGRGTQDVSVKGALYNQNNYQQDGAEINNFGTGLASDSGSFYGGIAVPNPDSIQEFKIQTSFYDAGYGRNAGANVNVITKSGGNTIHGSLWEFLRNTVLNANDFFLNESGQPRAAFIQNQFGGTLGGPVKKNKLFFFGSYQGTRQVNGLASAGQATAVLPPLTNDRSAAALGAKFCPQNNPGSSTFFPETVQVACNGSNINPVALNILNAKLPNGTYYIPTPQKILANGLGFSSWSIPAYFTEDQYMINADFLISPKHTLSARVFISEDPWTLSFSGTNPVPGSAYKQRYANETALARLTSVLSPRLVNEARMSFSRIPVHSSTGETLTAPGVGMTPIQKDFDYLPVIQIEGLFTAGGNGIDTYTQNTNQFQWADQLSWTHGRHTIRTGFEAERVQWNWEFIGSARGQLVFLSFADFLLGQSAKTNGSPLGFSNIYAAVGSSYPPGGIPEGLRINSFNSFVQDDFKINNRFTLNLGLRWEYDGLLTDKYGNLTNVWQSLLQTQPIPPPGGTLVGYVVPANFQGPIPQGVYKNNNKTFDPGGAVPLTDFAPRAGFAWQPLATSKLMVRGGAGYFYDRPSGNYFILGITFNSVPKTAGQGGTGAGEALGTLQNPWNPFNAPGWTPRTANFTAGTSSNLGAGIFAESLPTPLLQEYNLNVQYEFPGRLLAELGYVGSHGIHLQDRREINQPDLASPRHPVNGLTTNTTQNAALRAPYPGFATSGLVSLLMVEDNAGMRYNSLVASLKKGFSHGLQFGVAYTWSRSLTDLAGITSFGGMLGSNNVNDLPQMWGPSDISRAQRLVIDYIWNLPSYRGANRFADKFLSGWGVAGVTIGQSGFYMTPTDSSGGTIYGSSGTATGTPCPGITANQLTTSGNITSRLTNYFNNAAFCAPVAIGNGTGYGTLGRGDVTGPGQFNWDAAVLKTTTVGGITESARLDFRAEFFNALNHPQFANPGLAIGSAGFGQITSASVAPRLIQFGLKYSF